MTPILVIGLGNPDRGDDAIGPAIADALAALAPPGFTILRAEPDPLALPQRWQGYPHVILIDAAAPLGSPGRIHRLDASTTNLPRELGLGSTHAFGLAQAVELARVLGQLPPRLTVYAIEAHSFAHGAPLSPAVAATIAPIAAELASGNPACTKPAWSAT